MRSAPHLISILGLGLATGLLTGWWVRGWSEGRSTARSADAALPTSAAPPPAFRPTSGKSAAHAGLAEAAAEVAALKESSVPGQPNAELVKRLHGALADPQATLRLRRFSELLDAMQPDDVEAVAGVFLQQWKEGKIFSAEKELFWHQCGVVAPERTVSFVTSDRDAEGFRGDVLFLPEVYAGWAATDLQSAVQAAERAEPGLLKWEAVEGIVCGAARSDLDFATRFALEHWSERDESRVGFGGMLAGVALNREGLAGARHWLTAHSEAPEDFLGPAFKALCEASETTGNGAEIAATAKAALAYAKAEPAEWIDNTGLWFVSLPDAEEQHLLHLVNDLMPGDSALATDATRRWIAKGSLSKTQAEQWLRENPDAAAAAMVAAELGR